MKGVILDSVKEAIVTKYSDEIWKKIFNKSKLDKHFPILKTQHYDDEIFYDLLDKATNVLNVSLDQLLEVWAEYYINTYLPKQYKYICDEIKSSKDLLSQLDEIHIYLSQALELDKAPRFFYENITEKQAVIRYKSVRNLFNVFLKLLEAIKKKFQDFDYNVIAKDKVQIIYK